jgi:hypothetical protein
MRMDLLKIQIVEIISEGNGEVSERVHYPHVYRRVPDESTNH